MSSVMKCMCEECNHNKNSECTADSIEIRSSGDKKVESSDGTCCNTFKSKNDTSR